MKRSRIAVAAGTAAVVTLVAVLTNGCASLGFRASGARRTRMEQSPEWRDGQFVNPQPLTDDAWKMLSASSHPSPDANPHAPVPVVVPDPKMFATPPTSGLRVTWFGHSSTLVELEGHRVLTDPLWSMRVSPVPGFGPERWYPPPIALADLLPIDAVVISHDHYDHLDYRTIAAMKDWKNLFIVPLGVGANLEGWGIPRARIIELDWWQHAEVHGLDIVSVPSRHASGRVLLDRDAKLWTGYALIGKQHRVYFSGDTGLFPGMRDIGERFGPFDLTMIEVGQYDASWPDWHLGPEQAVKANQMVRGSMMLPVHWGALSLAPHGWTEPIERAVVAAQAAGVSLITPRPGESFEPSSSPPTARWWPTLPWRTGAEDPIVATQVN